MKICNAYLANDGTIHRSLESAAGADLRSLGFDITSAELIVAFREEVGKVLAALDRPYNIPTHYDVAAKDAA